jgi:hypothetical protein
LGLVPPSSLFSLNGKTYNLSLPLCVGEKYGWQIASQPLMQGKLSRRLCVAALQYAHAPTLLEEKCRPSIN